MQLFQARSRRSGQWVTEVGALVAMLIYVGIVELIVMTVNPTLEGFGLVGTSIVLAKNDACRRAVRGAGCIGLRPAIEIAGYTLRSPRRGLALC